MSLPRDVPCQDLPILRDVICYTMSGVEKIQKNPNRASECQREEHD